MTFIASCVCPTMFRTSFPSVRSQHVSARICMCHLPWGILLLRQNRTVFICWASRAHSGLLAWRGAIPLQSPSEAEGNPTEVFASALWSGDWRFMPVFFPLCFSSRVCIMSLPCKTRSKGYSGNSDEQCRVMYINCCNCCLERMVLGFNLRCFEWEEDGGRNWRDPQEL